MNRSSSHVEAKGCVTMSGQCEFHQENAYTEELNTLLMRGTFKHRNDIQS